MCDSWEGYFLRTTLYVLQQVFYSVLPVTQTQRQIGSQI